MNMLSNSGTLWVVATPLGNPGDLSPRARDILSSVDGVLAEDTRRSGMLFAKCGVSATAFMSFHDHNEEDRLAGVIEWLKEGKSLALVSDAGTPLLSDPGYRLVRACRAEGIPVSPVPGPSAPLTALCASGLPPQPFVFLGFAPRKDSDRAAFFAPFAALEATVIFFERKDRLFSTLQCAAAALGNREACVARELTKTHEEFIFFTLDALPERLNNLLGEVTVMLGPPLEKQRSSGREADAVLAEEAHIGGKPREVTRRAALRLSGWSSKELYARLQNNPGKEE